MEDEEINFTIDFMKLIEKYIQTKSINVMEQRFEILKNELVSLSEEMQVGSFVDLDTSISLNNDISDNVSSSIMAELGSMGFDSIPEQGVYVRLKMKE